MNRAFPTQEKETCQALRKELEDERRRTLRMEARVEEQLAEFDTEREQLRSRLKKEEAHCCGLQQQVGTRIAQWFISAAGFNASVPNSCSVL